LKIMTTTESNTLGTVVCGPCGFPRVAVKGAKGGAISAHCSGCGAITMVKSPDGVAKVRAHLGAGAAPAAAAAPAASNDWLSRL
jgi:hypothetical protein